MPGQTCNARNVFVVIFVYTIVISYVVYDFYFTTTDLSHYLGQDGDVHGEQSALLQMEMEKGKQTESTKREGRMDQSKNAVNEKVENIHRSVSAAQEEAQSVDGSVHAVTESIDAHNTNSSLVHETARTISENKIKSDDNKIEIYGTVDAGKKYAAFGCTTPNGDDYTFPFYLPLSVHAWQRVSYSSIVIIIGRKEEWSQSEILRVVLNQLQSMGAVLIFIHSKPDQALMLSQVSRLFVPAILPWTPGEREPYLVTADADIWPLSATLYDLMPGTKIVSSNSECCGYFNHKGQNFKMLPMCYIGMYFSTWSEVMGLEPGKTISSSNFFIDYLAAEFGDIVKQQVSKGENNGWYLDQHLISIRIQQWALKNSPNLIQYIRRDTGFDRVDRLYWNPHSIEGKKDSHLIHSSYKPGTWERLLPLMHQMFNQTIMSAAEKYREQFLRMLYQGQGHH